MAYLGCAPQAGWGCIFMTRSTKMGLHFQAFFIGVAHLWNFESKKILTSRNRNITVVKNLLPYLALLFTYLTNGSHNNLVLAKNYYSTPVREQLRN